MFLQQMYLRRKEQVVYSIKQITVSGSSVSVDEDAFFVHIGADESNIYAEGGSLGLGEKTADTSDDTNTGFLNRLFFRRVKTLAVSGGIFAADPFDRMVVILS